MHSLLTKVLHRILLLLLVIWIASAGCKRNPTSPQIPDTEDGLWTIYTPYNWSHDGQPYSSTYCIVYSDEASYEMKQQLAEISDSRFSQIMQLFNFHDVSAFRYPPGGSKIEVYINRNHPENIAWAYWGGFIITIRSSELIGYWYNYVVYTTRHELTHIFEFLIEGREVLGTDVWFKEGIAVHVGCLENTGWQTIENLSELESWISQNQNVPGQGNPIGIHQNEDFPPGADRHQYYRFFELAMRYLLDRRGMGRSLSDVLNLFYDMREGISFPVSFRNNFGISLVDFENEFYDRMRAYLSSTYRH
jgi:hypothetical protein